VIIHVAFALLALLAFSALAVDYGLMWLARGQAQTAADAGALSAATSLAFVQVPVNPEDMADPAYGRAKTAGATVARQNIVIGQPPRVDETTDVLIVTCPEPIPGMTDKCVRVNAYRNQEGGAGNAALPTFFAQLVGVADQGVRATATAQIYPGVQASCIKPWAIPDLWTDWHDESPPTTPVGVPPTADDQFEKYEKRSNGSQDPDLPLADPDVYVRPRPPGETGATGYRAEGVRGRFIQLKVGTPEGAIMPGWFNPIVLPDPDDPANPCTGGDCYREAITGCNPTAVQPGGSLFTSEPGNMVGPTRQGVRDLVALDPTAHVECTGSGASRSCAVVGSGCPSTASACLDGRSARWAPVAIYDPEWFLDEREKNGRFEFWIVEVIGVFIEGMYNDLSSEVRDALIAENPGVVFDNDDVIGRFMPLPARGASREGTSTFLRSVVLVR